MPPTATGTPTLTGPILLQNSSGSISLAPPPGPPPSSGLSSVYVSHFQPVHIMNSCLQTQGPMQMTPDGWTTFLPLGAQPGTLMVHPMSLLQQGTIPGPTPVTISQQPVVSCTTPSNQFFNPLTNSTNMEVVWHGAFDQLFSAFYPDMWTLVPVSTIPTEILKHYKVFHDSAKVRFLCQTCGKAWTSMKGRVIFVFNLDQNTNQGVVFFKLFGQQCQKCTPGSFEHAMWYPEEVNKVVTNIFHSVGKAYYGMVQAPVYRERRKGKPRTQHNSSLCQACADNICSEGNFEKVVNLGQ